MFNKILENINLLPSNINVRTFLVICVSVFMIGTISMWSTLYYAKHQVDTYEKKIEQKDPEFMQSLLSRCQGNLYDSRVVQSCLDLNYEDNNGEHKKTIKIQYAKITLWILFWGSLFMGYFFLLKKQTGIDLISMYKQAFRWKRNKQ